MLYASSPFVPSTVAEIVTAPGLRAVTLPKRSTGATAGFELTHRTVGCGRTEPSACVAFAICASVTPANRLPASGVICTRNRAGQVTFTGIETESGAGASGPRRPVKTVATTL